MDRIRRKSALIFSFIIIAVLAVLLLVTCAKEYSYEGGPFAVYTLAGSPTQCTQANVNGHYYAGIETDSSNSVQVTVNVTVAGRFNIYTTQVNGLTFSSSGNFSDTGSYSVTLNCSGVPDSAGNFVVAIPGSNGCYFNLIVNKPLPSGYTLSGYPNDCQNPIIKGTYIDGQSFSNTNTVTISVNIVIPGTYSIHTDTLDGIYFSASGYFSATGNQSVILTGTGTPALPGLIFFTLTADSSQCNFSLPVRSADPLATYVLESGSGSPNPCTPQTAQGNYVSGTLLDNTNTVTIGVYVTVVGNYSISTNKVNGMVFSATGTFTTTGAQTVVLNGTGTALSSGNFLFLPQIIGPAPLGGSTCGFNIIVI